MKKFVKIGLITAGILFVVGCLLVVISVIAGGHQLATIIREDEALIEKVGTFVDKAADAAYKITDGEWGYVWEDGNSDELVVNKNIVTGQENWYQVSAKDVTGLYLELGAGSFTIEEKETSDDNIDIAIEGIGSCNYFVKNGILHIEGFKGINVIGNDINLNNITLRLPKGHMLEQIDTEVGAGLMTITGLKVKGLDAEIGAGELKLEKIEAEELLMEIGAGRLEASEMAVTDAEITVSMGECVYKGSIGGNLDAECDMGNIDLKIDGKETDHNYQVECAAGNIAIGGFSFSALAAERNVDNNAASDFDIECNMGNISIRFTE